MKASLTAFLTALINAILAVQNDELKKELIPLLLCAQRIKEEGEKLRRNNQSDQEIDHTLPASFSDQPVVKEVFKHFPSSSKMVGGKCTYLLGIPIHKGWNQTKMTEFVSTLIREIRQKDNAKQPQQTSSFNEQVMGVLREAAEEVTLQQRIRRLKLDAQFPSPPN